jgi:acetyl-CoA C-acetyltransferase
LTETVIVGMARTAFGRLGGTLADVPAVDLGAAAIKEAVARSTVDPGMLDYVIMGEVITGGVGQMPARQASLKAGMPMELPVINVNKVCISSISALVMADQAIRCGDADIIVTGGMESMSQGCYYVPKARFGYRMGNGKLIDGMVHDALWCAINDWHMGEGTDRVAEELGTTREEQDLWSARSQEASLQKRSSPSRSRSRRRSSSSIKMSTSGRRRRSSRSRSSVLLSAKKGR